MCKRIQCVLTVYLSQNHAKQCVMDNMFSVRISNHNPFSNFGVAVTPTMKFGDLGRNKKAKRKSSSSGSSGGSGDDSLGDCDSTGKTEFQLKHFFSDHEGRSGFYFKPVWVWDFLREKLDLKKYSSCFDTIRIDFWINDKSYQNMDSQKDFSSVALSPLEFKFLICCREQLDTKSLGLLLLSTFVVVKL